MQLHKISVGRYPLGYTGSSTFIKYSTEDGNTINYEVYKHIQCKALIMDRFDYGFKWSGTTPPKISSKVQEIGRITESEEGHYDNAVLHFKQPLLYNQNSLIHILMELDDADHQSSTYLEIKVQSSTLQLGQFRVELKYKPDNYSENAVLSIKKIDTEITQDYKEIKQIPFDGKTKSYEYNLIEPKAGFFYRLTWVR